jgi:hypothetical protein
MAVQVARRVHQTAVGRLLFDQVPQAPGHLVTVLALQLRMAGAQQGQQHHARRAVQGIRVRPGGTALAAHAGVLAQLLVETPRTVVALMADQPLQGEFHRVFAFGRCPLRQRLPPSVAAPRQAAARVLAHRESRIPARLGFRGRDLDCQLPRDLLQLGEYHLRVSDLRRIQHDVVQECLIRGDLQHFFVRVGWLLDDHFHKLIHIRLVLLGIDDAQADGPGARRIVGHIDAEHQEHQHVDDRAEQPSGHRLKQHKPLAAFVGFRRLDGGQLSQLLLHLPFQERIDRRGHAKRGAGACGRSLRCSSGRRLRRGSPVVRQRRFHRADHGRFGQAAEFCRGFDARGLQCVAGHQLSFFVARCRGCHSTRVNHTATAALSMIEAKVRPIQGFRAHALQTGFDQLHPGNDGLRRLTCDRGHKNHSISAKPQSVRSEVALCDSREATVAHRLGRSRVSVSSGVGMARLAR